MTGREDARSDEELIAAINRGDDAAFAVLYHRYRDWVINLAYRFTGNREDAIDVMQDVFMYVLKKFPGFELTSQFKTFLYPAVKHTAIAMRDKRQRTRELDPQSTEAMLAADVTQASDTDIMSLLNALGETHREAVILRFVEDMTLEEIATALDLPVGTVKSRLHHAVTKMRDDPQFRKFFEID